MLENGEKWKKVVFLYNFCAIMYTNSFRECYMKSKSLKTIWKNIILLGIPVIIAVLSVLCSLLNETAKEWFGICVAGIVLFGLFYIGAVIYYAKEEKDRESKISELEKELEELKSKYDIKSQQMEDKYQSIQVKNEILGYIVATYKETIRGYSVSINDIANDIINHGVAEKKDWNIAQLCDTICKSCRELIKKIAKVEDNISVGYISTYIRGNEQYVNMIAHSDTTKPNVYKSEELLKDCSYYYASLIKRNNPQIKAFATKEEILSHFRARHDDTDLSKYSQYIALPVMCDANKIIGVLQIVIKNDLKVRDTDNELIGLAETYVTPYVSLLVLINKLDKGLFAIPNRKEG